MPSGEAISSLINSVFVLNGGLSVAFRESFGTRVLWGDCGAE